MSDTPVDVETDSTAGPSDTAAQPESPLDRAAAQGPLHWGDDAAPGEVSNLEAGAAHDSPAAVDEERAGQEEVDYKDSLSSIYGPPPGESA